MTTLVKKITPTKVGVRQGSDKRATKKVAVKESPAIVEVSKVLLSSPSLLIKNPRITEKATMLAESAIYTFNVAVNATKPEIIKAVKALFKVTPRKIRMITVHPRSVTVRGKRGTQSGGKKALIYLKKGDKINFV